jgi:hypothetical protein
MNRPNAAESRYTVVRDGLMQYNIAVERTS